MRVKQVTFSITRTLPLYPITKDANDQYANVKPFASCTVEFDEDKQESVVEAFRIAQDACFNQLVQFNKDFMAALKK